MDNNQNNGYFDRTGETGNRTTDLPPLGANVLYPTTGLGTAALVCGILGIVFSCCCCIGILPAAIAIILALVDRKQTAGFSGVSLGGLICGIIGALLSILILVAWTVTLNTFTEELLSDPVFSSIFDEMRESLVDPSV